MISGSASAKRYVVWELFSVFDPSVSVASSSSAVREKWRPFIFTFTFLVLEELVEENVVVLWWVVVCVHPEQDVSMAVPSIQGKMTRKNMDTPSWTNVKKNI